MAQLVYFVHVAHSASFAATARELDVTPEAVRLGMNALEAVVGLRLFHRTPQRISLTPPGRLMLPLAQRIVYLAEVIATAGAE